MSANSFQNYESELPESGSSDPVNPLIAVTEACKPKCVTQQKLYDSCVDRIKAKVIFGEV